MEKMEELCCPPDTRTYNILIKMAPNYFRKMEKARLVPDLVSYCTLLYAYSIRRMVSEVEDVVLEMDQKDFEIDEFARSALTRMYIEVGDIEKSWLWFERFHFAGNMSSKLH